MATTKTTTTTVLEIDGLVGSPKWLIVRTNLTRFRSFSVLCGYEKREFGKILSRQVDLFTREMEIKCERFIIS